MNKKDIKITAKKIEKAFANIEKKSANLVGSFAEHQNEFEKIENKYNANQFQDKTRAGITSKFLTLTFLLFAGIFIFFGIYNFIIGKIYNKENAETLGKLFISFGDIKEIISIFANFLGPLLGFILGFYFKETQNKNSDNNE